MKASLPDAVAPLLSKLVDALPSLLGNNLVGFYLYGSLLDSAFDPARSDVDCIVVTERPLDEAAFGRLDERLAALAQDEPSLARLQMSLLVKEQILREDPSACLYQFGVLRRSGSDGNPLIWMDFFQRGRTLLGPRPDFFVPNISSGVLHAALLRELDYLREEISAKRHSEWRDQPSYRAYSVLTLCRILYSLRSGDVASKPRAAAWARDHVPSRWHELIQHALLADEADESDNLPVSEIGAFIDHVQAELDRQALPAGKHGDHSGRAT